MPENAYFIIDFDSTFTKVEALDELAEIVMERSSTVLPDLKAQIADLTDQAMGGKLSFREALEQRIQLLSAHIDDLAPLVDRLRGLVSESFKRNREFFDKHAEQILVVSSGFKDFILPIVEEYGVRSENVYANTFTFDEEGNITGFDEANVLSSDNGKVRLLESLQLEGKVVVIGDGYTDYEIREAGLAEEFYAFTENVNRENVVAKADTEIGNLDEFLFVNNLARNISYPKSRIKILLLEGIHPQALETFKRAGYDQVELLAGALNEEELCEKIKDVSIIGIRSKTKLTAKVLEHANRLLCVSAFCIGTNQIDLEACTKRGIPVFNAPYSNTRSVVELAISQMILLMRNLPDRIREMHEGKWQKSAKNSFEVRGKNLGIVGYGNIGSQLSVLAESMGLNVYFYDLEPKLALGNAKRCETFEELLELADIITLHVDGRPENKNIIRKEHFDKMKHGVIFMNLARGSVVEIPALVEALESGKVRGASVDVFPKEPKTNDEPFTSELQGLPNLILTPHIGGSTMEAQFDIANFVPTKIIDYIDSGNTSLSVNFPELQLPTQPEGHRLIHIHENRSGILAQINQVLASHQANIMGQYLKTNEAIGYVITDINKEYDKSLLKALKAIEGTIRFRTLY
ncbi:MAG: phosphoglycerate dehydrogenase [Bacteroidota bacterium]